MSQSSDMESSGVKPSLGDQRDAAAQAALTPELRQQRSTMRLSGIRVGLVCAALALLVWALFARMDIVIPARGEITANREPEKVEHLEGGQIAKLYVNEGDTVVKGQLIAELVGLDRKVEQKAQEQELADAQAESTVLKSLIQNSKSPDLSELSLAADQKEIYSKFHEAEANLLSARLGKINTQIQSKQETVGSMEKRLALSKEQVQTISEQLKIREDLLKAEAGSYMDVVNARVQLLNMRREEQNLVEGILNEKNSINQLKQERIELLAGAQQDRIERLRQATKVGARLKQTDELQRDRVERLTVRSPIDGYIDKLPFNYHSAVVPPGQSVALITPAQAEMIAQIRINPRDIGFVKEGQAVRLRVDTYNSNKYGYIKGQLASISKTSFKDEKETYYTARVQMDKPYIEYRGNRLHVQTKMELTADIDVGQRSALEYFAKPLADIWSTGFREH